MTDSIVSSRRDFLKMLGIGVGALAAAPVLNVAEVLALPVAEPVVAPPSAFLPPNVLHLLTPRGWQAIGGIQSMEIRREPLFEPDFYGRPLVLPGHTDLTAGLGWPVDGWRALHDLFNEMPDHQRWAISLSGAQYEFDGLLSSIEERLQAGMIEATCRLSGLSGMSVIVA